MGIWLRTLLGDGYARAHVVSFPHAGGSASFFRSWRGCLPPQIALHSVRYPGREDRLQEALPDDLVEMSTTIAADVAGLGRGSLVLFGHSLGAAVAYETARILEQRYLVSPAAVVVSGRPAPHVDPGGNIHQSGEEAMWREIRNLGGTDASILESAEMRDLVAPVMRADYAMSETYQSPPGRKLDCPVVAMLGTDDPEVSLGQAKAWGDCTYGTFEVRSFSGGHFYLADHGPQICRELVTWCLAPGEMEWPLLP